MPHLRAGLALLAFPLAACSVTVSDATLTQISDGLVVAQAAETAYAVRADANAAVTEQLAALTGAAQAALATYRASGSTADQAAAQAALAGLTTFLAMQAPTRALAARAPGTDASGAGK